MISESLARAQLRAQERKEKRELAYSLSNKAIGLLNNPMVALIVGVTVVEQLQIHKVIGTVEKYGLYTAMGGSTMLNALSKAGILEEISKSTGTAVNSAIPLLMAGALS
jgi:hypothetical protein